MATPPSVQPMLAIITYTMPGLHLTYGCPTFWAAYLRRSTYRITGLHYTYGYPTLRLLSLPTKSQGYTFLRWCTALSAAYICNFYLENH